MDQTTKLRCWNCKDTFHMRIRSQDYRSPSLVSKTVPCPYCGSFCRIQIHEDQVPTVSVHRQLKGEAGQPSAVPWGDLLQPGALVDQIFASTSPDEPDKAC